MFLPECSGWRVSLTSKKIAGTSTRASPKQFLGRATRTRWRRWACQVASWSRAAWMTLCATHLQTLWSTGEKLKWLLMRTPIMVIGIEIRRSGSVLSQQVGKAVRITVAALNSWEKLAYRQSSHSLVFAGVDVTIGSTSSAAVNTTLCNTIAGYSIRTSTK